MILYSIPPFLTLCCFIGLSAITLRRGIKTKIHALFAVICILGCFLYIDILLAFNLHSEAAALRISRIDHAFIVFLMPLYLHFFHVYLPIKKRQWLIWLSYILALILMPLTQTDLYIEAMHAYYYGFYAKGGPLYPVFGLAAIPATVYVLVIIYGAIKKERISYRKNSLKYVLAGFGIMGLLNGLNVLPNMGYALYPPGNFSFIPLMILYFGLFKHDLFDMGGVIKTGFIYSILTALVTGLYALLVIAANIAFSDSRFTQSAAFPIVYFILAAIALGPLKTRTQAVIDRHFYREKYDYQKALRDISRIIIQVRDLPEIIRYLETTVTTSMKVKHFTPYIRLPLSGPLG